MKAKITDAFFAVLVLVAISPIIIYLFLPFITDELLRMVARSVYNASNFIFIVHGFYWKLLMFATFFLSLILAKFVIYVKKHKKLSEETNWHFRSFKNNLSLSQLVVLAVIIFTASLLLASKNSIQVDELGIKVTFADSFDTLSLDWKDVKRVNVSFPIKRVWLFSGDMSGSVWGAHVAFRVSIHNEEGEFAFISEELFSRSKFSTEIRFQNILELLRQNGINTTVDVLKPDEAYRLGLFFSADIISSIFKMQEQAISTAKLINTSKVF